MLTAREWTAYVALPLVGAVLLDQAAKDWAQTALTSVTDLGWLELRLHRNPGFFLGAQAALPKLYTVIAPATIAALLLFVQLVVQYFLPIRAPGMRLGIALFTGAVIANMVDRVLAGAVVDFLVLRTPFGPTGIFNPADALQWAGLGIFAFSYVRAGALLYPPEQRRGRKWIDPAFQLRYCAVLIAAGLGFAVVGGVLSWLFLEHAAGVLGRMASGDAAALIRAFLVAYMALAAAFFVMLFVIGVMLSHRIVGPIRGFETFLEGILAGDARRLRLRSQDEFRHLEALADRFYAQFHEGLGVDRPPLAAGTVAPDFAAATADGGSITMRELLGAKVWLIFYRYATCPLCAAHLQEVRDLIAEAQAAGVRVVAVYESTPDRFFVEACAATAALLKGLGVPLVSDPERRLYRAFRTRRRLSRLLDPRMWLVLLRARLAGFRQDRIDGALGQLPAHFLIDAKGVIQEAYYGESMVDHIAPERVRTFIQKASGLD